MDARQAFTLQRHAVDALEQLRAWLGTREAELARSAPAEASPHAAYASWGAQVDAAIRAIGKAFPEHERRPGASLAESEPESAPATLPSRGAARSGSWPEPLPPSQPSPEIPPSPQQPPRSPSPS